MTPNLDIISDTMNDTKKGYLAIPALVFACCVTNLVGVIVLLKIFA